MLNKLMALLPAQQLPLCALNLAEAMSQQNRPPAAGPLSCEQCQIVGPAPLKVSAPGPVYSSAILQGNSQHIGRPSETWRAPIVSQIRANVTYSLDRPEGNEEISKFYLYSFLVLKILLLAQDRFHCRDKSSHHSDRNKSKPRHLDRKGHLELSCLKGENNNFWRQP